MTIDDNKDIDPKVELEVNEINRLVDKNKRKLEGVGIKAFTKLDVDRAVVAIVIKDPISRRSITLARQFIYYLESKGLLSRYRLHLGTKPVQNLKNKSFIHGTNQILDFLDYELHRTPLTKRIPATECNITLIDGGVSNNLIEIRDPRFRGPRGPNRTA